MLFKISIFHHPVVKYYFKGQNLIIKGGKYLNGMVLKGIIISHHYGAVFPGAVKGAAQPLAGLAVVLLSGWCHRRIWATWW